MIAKYYAGCFRGTLQQLLARIDSHFSIGVELEVPVRCSGVQGIPGDHRLAATACDLNRYVSRCMSGCRHRFIGVQRQ